MCHHGVVVRKIRSTDSAGRSPDQGVQTVICKLGKSRVWTPESEIRTLPSGPSKSGFRLTRLDSDFNVLSNFEV